ncbi:MAG: YraN family protein [Sedimentisphaerales bacterium]|nr:YraN family protein [Sedimentisphaerales bacterium]
MWLPRFYRRYLRADTKRLGRWGERQALRRLRRKGYTVIARNWRCEAGEVDLVMADPNGTVAFVEVKTRRDEIWAAAQDAVGYAKRKHISSVARYFVQRYGIKDRPLRFDIVAVILTEKDPVEIRHYENAFRVTQ